MEILELEKRLKELEAEKNYEDANIVLEKINKIIETSLYQEIDDNKRKTLERTKKINEIKLLQNKLSLNPPKNMELYYRGHLLKELKEYLKIALPSEVNAIRMKLDKEIEIHRENCKSIRINKEEKIPITKKLGLKIKEISDSIHLFLSKHDVINKAKRVLSSTIIGGAMATGINALITVLLGGGLSAATLISTLPVMAYMGISAIVRNIITKTPYEVYQYKNSEEYLKLIKEFAGEYKEDFQKIVNLVKEKETSNDKIAINNQLIEIYDNIKNNSKVEEMSKLFKVEKHNLLLENKELYEDKIDKYLDDRIKLTKQEYQALMKAKLKNDVAIFESENAIKEAVKVAGKNTAIDAGVIVIARTICNFIIPGYKFTSLSDLLVPLGYMAMNNLIGIIKYNGKIKETKYADKKVVVNNKEKLMELAHSKQIGKTLAVA